MARKRARRVGLTSGKGSQHGAKKSANKYIISRHDISVQRSRGRKSNAAPASWTLRRFAALSDKQQDTYFRAKRVIDEARSGRSPSRAARDNKTTLATARRYFPDDFFKAKRSRRWSVSSSDRHPNQVQWLGPDGYEDFVLRGSREASHLGRYLNNVKRALRGDVSALDKWRGKKIGGRRLITDLKKLEQLARDGKLDFEDDPLWRS